ncbi:MAG TPA: hypothetical protein PLV92_29125, partial [Pirellulaceae bacterium]|nr:hypothetical protein [Pirellulaceae bacterium]
MSLTHNGLVTLDGTMSAAGGGGNGGVQIDGAGGITVNATLSSGSGVTNLAVAPSSFVTLNANITTSGGVVQLSGSTKIQSGITIDTTNAGGVAAGANVSFSSTVDSSTATPQSLTIAAGTGGAVTMTGAVGATNPLSSLQVTAGNLTLGTSLKTTGSIDLTADRVALPTTADSVSGGSITIQTQTASRRLDIVSTETGSNLELTTTEIAALKNGFSSITLGRSNGTGGISVATPVTFNDPVTLRSPNGGTINVAGQITGAGDASVTLTSGASGLIQLSSNIVTAGQAVTLTGPVQLAADVSIDTTNAGGAAAGAAISFSSTVNSS